MLERLANLFEQVADIAQSIQKKLAWFLLLAVVCVAVLAFKLISAEHSVWWNVFVGLTIGLPLLVWVFIWYVLGQLCDAPDLAADLMKDQDGALANLGEISVSQPNGLRGLAATVQQFRQHDGLETVFDAIKGIGLLISPVFLVLSIVFLFGLIGLILLTPIVLLF